MTRAGKILLFANLVLSLIMAAWGMALYSGRINWTNKSTPEAGPGELSKVQDAIKQLQPIVAAADARYREAEAALANAQRQRAANLTWYQAKADDLKFNANDQNPPIVPVLIGGVPVWAGANPQNAPIQVDVAKDRAGDPLRSSAAYVSDLLTNHDKISETMDNLDAVNKQYIEVSNQIVGVTKMDGNVLKVITPGLRQLLQDELDKLANVKAEIERLRPLLVNSYAEIQHLAKRHGLLQSQVEGLGGKADAGTGVDK
ncbi:MAG TPA: hypothetical protein VGG61_12170 [Gemmataceae bacterium]|jgi:hypothetical protein